MTHEPRPPPIVDLQETYRRKLVEYDAARRRLWILGQRCHHGATGALIATAGLTRIGATGATVAVAAGAALMAHDWKDRSIWFERGHGNQP